MTSLRGAWLLLLLGLFASIPAEADEEATSEWASLEILDVIVEPGEIRRATWNASESFAGVVLATPVFIIRGATSGPTLCMTAGIHGDELNGIEIVRRTIEATDVETLRGSLIGVPIVNLHGFRRSSRYLPDRRDLNRFFPGRAEGSAASRIAYAFFEDVVRACDYLVDLHTGSFHRSNLAHVRADLDAPTALALARGFGTSIVVHSVGSMGTLRRAAMESGIPAITYEAGEPMRFHLPDVDRGVQGIRNVMRIAGMLPSGRRPRWPEVFRRSHWVRCDKGGILFSKVELGDRVKPGDVLGTVTDPLSNEKSVMLAPHAGTVIGKAVDQVVMPGFAAYHLGIREGDRSGLAEEGQDWMIEAVEESDYSDDERPEE
jgi:predicted deacylase